MGIIFAVIKLIQKIYFLGPLTAFVNGKVVVVGISSFVRGNCSLGYPNVFARVTFQKSWILSNTDAGAYQCVNVTGNK